MATSFIRRIQQASTVLAMLALIGGTAPLAAFAQVATTTPPTTVTTTTDTTAPVITLNGDAAVTLTVGDTWTDPGFTATDDTDGDISSNVIVGGDKVDTTTASTYNVTYDVSDAAGNKATEVTRTVIVNPAATTTPTDPTSSPIPTFSPKFKALFATPSTTVPPYYVDSVNGDDSNNGSEATPFKTLQAAVTAANSGDTIYVKGVQNISSTISITKDLDIEASTGGELDVTGTGHALEFNPGSDGSTLQGFAINKTDTTDQNIVLVNANNVSIEDNQFSGQYNLGGSVTQRGLEISGITGLDVGGNTFNHLRQPAYINNATGSVHDNYTDATKGFVVVSESHITFTDNSWGTNIGDIAIVADSPVGPDNYADIVSISNANNDAVVEDQMVTPHVLSVVYVDASAAAGGNGTKGTPYQDIQSALPRAITGGTIHVAAGTYAGDLMIPSDNLTIEGTGSVVLNLGAGYGINLDNNVSAKGLKLSGFTVNASPSTTYALKAYDADGLTLTNDTFNGGSGNTGGGVDFNTTSNIMLDNVSSTGFHKNGFAFTPKYQSTDTAGTGITFNDVTASNNGWTGVAFYTTNNAGTVGSNVTGVHFTGTDNIGNNGEGLFLEGDTDANRDANNNPTYTVTSDDTTLDVSHVAFNYNGVDIDNYQSAPVNAIGASFGGLTGDEMTQSQRNYEDAMINDQKDHANRGLVTFYTADSSNPVVSVTPTASVISGTTTFTITVTDDQALDPSKNKNVWVYLYNDNGDQKHYGANVDLSSGTGTFTVDTTLLDDGAATLDVGQVYDAAGNASGAGDNYFSGYTVDNAPGAPSTVTVTIDKYLDGNQATTDNTNGASFPMHAIYPGGEGDYTLSPVGYNNPDAYKATTSDMPSGSDYSTYETATQSCTDAYPFKLDGYSTGSTLEDAASAPVTMDTPAFTDLTSNEFVIVHNESCSPEHTPSVTTNAATDVSSSDATLNATNGDADAQGHSIWVSTAPFDTSSPNIPSGVYSTPDMGAINAGDSWSASLSSLTTSGVPSNMPAVQPNTTYYYTAWVNVGGTWYPGEQQTFTTSNTVTELGAPTNLKPKDGKNTKDPNFDQSWSKVDGATSYEYETSYSVNEDGSLGPVIFSDNSVDQSSNYDLSGKRVVRHNNGTPPATYYWHVRAVDADGNVGPWSVINEVTETTQAAGPNAPVLETPENESSVNSGDVTFTWDPSAGDDAATSYRLRLSQDPTVSKEGGLQNGVERSGKDKDTTYSTTGLADGTWYWEVRGKDADGNFGDWSSVWSFTVNSASDNTLAAPDPVSPSDGTTLTSDQLDKVDWSDVSDDAGSITYTYEISNSTDQNEDGTLVSPVYTQSGLTQSEIATPNTPEGTYYWHVQAMDGDGNKSAWSTLSSFTVDNSSTNPTNPGDGGTVSTNNENSGTSGQFNPSFSPAVTPAGGSVLGASTFNFTRNLHIGMRGDDVNELQQMLISMGYKISSGATGYFGAQTRSALAAYQVAHNITPAAGYFGPVSRALFNKGIVPTSEKSS